MSLKRNFSVGLFAAVWSALLGLAVVPLYLKYLGTEAYGLIGFFATTQALLQLLDLGLAPTINREVARCSASGDMRTARNLLHTLAVVYWAMAAVIALIAVGLAPLIASHWLQPKHLSHDSVAHAVMLMGMVVACRWPVGLYMGALMGLQRIALASTIGMVMGTLSSLGAVAVLTFVSPTIEAFFIWQASVGLVYAVVMLVTAWRLMRTEGNESQKFNISDLKRIWRFSAGMSGVAVAAAVLMQTDKLLLSRLLNLADFGKYSLAWIVANSLYVLLMPIFNVIYPRFSALIAKGDIPALINLYRVGTRLLASVLFPLAILVGVFAEDLLYIWTKNENLAREVAPIARLLLIGSAINGIMIFPYALQLAYGAIRLPLTICLILIACTVPMTIFLALKFGTIGGAYSWITMTSIYLFMGSLLTHRVMLKEIGLKWLLWDVLTPLVSSLLVLSILGGWVREQGLSHMANILIAIAMGLIAAMSLISTSPHVKRALFEGFKETDFALKTFLNKRLF